MRKMLKVLCEAHPDSLPYATLRDVAGYEPSQFAGLMGAFRRRLVNTEGYESEAELFDCTWDDDEETWNYRLPDTVCEALALKKLV